MRILIEIAVVPWATFAPSPSVPELAPRESVNSLAASLDTTTSTVSVPRLTCKPMLTTGKFSNFELSLSTQRLTFLSILFSGSIGNVCSYPNGVASCNNGYCSLTGCQSGYQLKTTAFLGLLFPQTSCAAVDTSSDVRYFYLLSSPQSRRSAANETLTIGGQLWNDWKQVFLP